MNKRRNILYIVLLLCLIPFLTACNMGVLDPKGIIALDEKHVLIKAVVLMLVIVVPTMILTAIFARRYRASHTKAEYRPNWSHSTLIEIVCWTVPGIIILLLAIMTWLSSHRLDPYKPLDSDKKPLTIQVIALDWKWLFIYPDQKVASVNFAQIPVDMPITFLITADAPMNSLEMPQLAGQIYAMPGMQTKLHFMANEAGDYKGFSANYSGDGFAGMNFIVRASSQEEFDQWIKNTQKSNEKLDQEMYNKLAQPSENNEVEYFSAADSSLFGKVVMKYMMPASAMPEKAENSKEGN